MPHDLLLTPQLDQQRAAQLTRLAKRLDEQLDHPTGVLQSVPQSGLLEQLGTLLWEATRLEADTVFVRPWMKPGTLSTRCDSWSRASKRSTCRGSCSTTCTLTSDSWPSMRGAW